MSASQPNAQVLIDKTIPHRSEAEYLAAVEAMAPLIAERADEAERQMHLTDDVVGQMRDAGLFHMLLPRELGGPQVDYLTSMRVVERIAWVDASAGWYAMVANVVAASVGCFLPDEGVPLVYGNNPYTMAAGQGVPRGTARPVEGGYLIKGPWSYGSTIQHADFYHSGCFIVDDAGNMQFDDAGQPLSVVAHFPAAQGKLLGNWDTLGLRGTGSFDYDVAGDELFVPEAVCYPFVGTPPQRGGNQYSIGIIGFIGWCHTSWAMGVGRRLLDEVRTIARDKRNVFGLIADAPSFRQGYAVMESKYRAARAWVYEVWQDLSETLERGEPASVEQIALVRMAMRHMHDVDAEIAEFAWRGGGGVALRPSTIQRVYRDLHAGLQHIMLADQILQECGRVMLGLTAPGSRWGDFSVLEP